MSGPAMRLVPVHADLPVSWDGVPVTWGGWSAYRTTLVLHLKDNELVCHECGTVDERIVNLGMRPPEDGATVRIDRTKLTKRTRTAYGITQEAPAWPVKDLVALRCRHCRHDQVVDQRTGETWDLDDDDYGPEGSTETKDTLW